MKLKIEQSDSGNGIWNVKLTGPLDIAGANDAELPLSVVAGSKTKVVVDMTNVTFLASIGIRVLVMTARVVLRRGGRFVIFGASDEARRVLRSTGIDEIIPSVANEAEAIAECSK